MKRKSLILLCLLLLTLSNVFISNITFSIGDKQNPDQTTVTQTITETTDSKVDIITTPVSNIDEITTSASGVQFNSFSLILVLLMFLLSPILGIVFLFLGIDNPFGQIAPGFEAMSIIPIFLIVGALYLIIRKRTEN